MLLEINIILGEETFKLPKKLSQTEKKEVCDFRCNAKYRNEEQEYKSWLWKENVAKKNRTY